MTEPRRIADLAQLTDKRLFEEIAAGLVLIHENAQRLCASVELLAQQEQFRAAEIIKNVALEEAAKYLILIDAARCPRKPEPKLFSDHLWKFTDHLPRGIYAKVCDWLPANFKELREGVARECEAYYLDGPTSANWMFRNDIIRAREEALYVDYVVDDDGTRRWVSPQAMEELSSRMFFSEHGVIFVMHALHDVGFGAAEALAILAQHWRTWTFADDTRHAVLQDSIRQTLSALQESGMPPPKDSRAYGTLLERWPFPLHVLPMRRIETSKDKLREIQGGNSARY